RARREIAPQLAGEQGCPAAVFVPEEEIVPEQQEREQDQQPADSAKNNQACPISPSWFPEPFPAPGDRHRRSYPIDAAASSARRAESRGAMILRGGLILRGDRCCRPLSFPKPG